MLLAAGVLVVSIVVSVALANLTETGFLGFGIALMGIIMAVGSALCLREIRRVARSARRLEGSLARARRQYTALTSKVDRLEQRMTGLRDNQRVVTTGVRNLGKAAVSHEATLQTVVANQLEMTRAVSQGLDPEVLSSQLATQLRQQQAMLNLFGLLPTRGVMPTMGGWAASADVVAVLVDELLRVRPQLVVECGSGVSTLWTALAIDHLGIQCRVVSLDHDPHYAEQTRRTLRAHGVDQHAEVRDAPLVPADIEGHATAWYDRSALVGLSEIGLLFVDGPPDATGPLVRFPAVPLLKPLLAPTSTIVLDDLIRPGEKEVVARWRLQLPDFQMEQVPLQKGAAVFRRVAATRASD